MSSVVTSIAFVLAVVVARAIRVDRITARRGITTFFAQRSWFAPTIVSIVSLIVGAIPLMLGRVPPPSVHDEFSYLLAADTFAHGRLTNPTPKAWEQLETIHELMMPTYMSKFPPGQGLALAIGELLGAPIIGAILTIALACAAVTWMLRAWMPPRWAMLGGLIAATHPLMFWWQHEYWGGGVAMLGGALLSGACIRREPSGFTAGTGAAILMISRPLEGLIVALMLGAMLVVRWIRARQASSPALSQSTGRASAQFAAKALVVLLPALIWLGYYNHRVTGHALVMPYQEHAHQYLASPIFWWQPVPTEPNYRHEKIRQFHLGYERDVEFASQKTLAGQIEKLDEVPRDWIDPITLALPLLAAIGMLPRSGKARIGLTIIVGLVLVERLTTPWLRMQYLAPVAGFFFAAIALGLRRIANLKNWGATIVVAMVLTQFINMVVVIASVVNNQNPPGAVRQRIVDQLMRTPGLHLVLVHYAPGPQSIFEWVFNEADIGASKVVWARADSVADAQSVAKAYPGRNYWLLEVANSNIAPLRAVDPARLELHE